MHAWRNKEFGLWMRLFGLWGYRAGWMDNMRLSIRTGDGNGWATGNDIHIFSLSSLLFFFALTKFQISSIPIFIVMMCIVGRVMKAACRL